MASLSRRRLLAASATLAAGAWLVPNAAQAQATPLRVWRYKGAAATFMDLAGQLDTPYPVEWVDIGGGNLVLEALNSGSLDYVSMSEIPPIFAASAKVPIALIGVLPGDLHDNGIVVRKDAGIRSVADLKGKRISYVRATNTHYFVLDMLRQHGLTLADVQAVPMPMQDALIAFRSGHVDALTGGGISLLQAAREGGERLEHVSRFVGNSLIATSQAALQDPDKHRQLGDFLLREKATWAWVSQHPEAWARRCQEQSGIAAELYLQQLRQRALPVRLGAINEQAIASAQQVADTFFDNQLIRQPVDLRQLWRDDFSPILES
jgi:sulfonate transport system substrate-binding protein